MSLLSLFVENVKARRREAAAPPGDVTQRLGALSNPEAVARVRAQWLDSAQVNDRQSPPLSLTNPEL